MPFLRAALLKKKAIEQTQQEKTEEIIFPVEPVAPEIPENFESLEEIEEIQEPEEEKQGLTSIADLHRIIDERAEAAQAEEIQTELEPELLSEEESINEEEKNIEPEVESEEISQEPEQNLEEVEEIITEEAPEAESPQEFDENVFLDEIPSLTPQEPEPEQEIEEIETESDLQPEEILEEIQEPEIEQVPKENLEEAEEVKEPEIVLEPDSEPEKEPEEFKLQYDVTSGERYVDKVSTKTEFDKMLDELADISKDLLSWQVEKFAKEYTGKFNGEFEKSESDAKKYEAFLGGYITNAAMTLYDNGYRDAALKQLEQAQNILIARKKLEDETQAIKDRVEEEEALVDLSDILGMFGDG